MRSPDVRRVLVVTAHPDDADFGAAGTVATWTVAGIEVAYCVVTDGDAGGFDLSVPRSAIAGIRRAEQTKAAAEVGVTDVTFLGYPDGILESTLGLRRDIAREIRRVRPDRVVCMSPARDMRRLAGSHPDHLAAGEATLCAVFPDSRNPFTFTELVDEGYPAHTVREVWVMAGPGSDHVVDITATFDRKIAALRAHVSQHPDPDAMEQRVREWNTRNAEAAGLGPDRQAEAFDAYDTA